MKKNIVFAFVTALVMVACTNYDDLPIGVEISDNKATTRNSSTDSNEDIVISLEEAVNVANLFYDEQGNYRNISKGKKAPAKKVLPSTSIINDGDIPAMYVINYPNGGFVIVGASKNYYPILAYSDENNFDPTNNNTGVMSWIAETKCAIKSSKFLNDSIKVQMHRLWNGFDNTVDNAQETTKGITRGGLSDAEIACYERCEDLLNQYGYDGEEGWHFQPLSTAEQAFADAGYSAIYQNLCYSANFNHSPASQSVIGWKICTVKEEVGPLLSTRWNQHSPYNNQCNNHVAGCGTIALAQLMNYYRYPSNPMSEGVNFSWNNISSENSASISAFVKRVYDVIGTEHVLNWVFTRPGNMEDGIRDFGYNVTVADHNTYRVESELIQHRRPVIMLGNDWDMSILPGSLEYLGKSHYWICDGIKKTTMKRLYVFTEWQPNSDGIFVPGWYSKDNPDVQGGSVYLKFHMNWGWGGSCDGWYSGDVINTTTGEYDYNYNGYNEKDHEFEHSRKDFFISMH